MLDGDAAGDCKGGAFARNAPLLGFFWPFSCRNKKRANGYAPKVRKERTTSFDTVTFLCPNKKVTKEVVRGEALRANRNLAPDPTPAAIATAR